MSVTDTLSVLIVDQPGRERDALRAILASVKWVRIIDMVDSSAALDNWISLNSPEVVVIKIRNFDLDCIEQFKRIQACNMYPHYLVIANTLDQCLEFQKEGADETLLKGFSNIELSNILEDWILNKSIKDFTKQPGSPVKIKPDLFSENTSKNSKFMQVVFETAGSCVQKELI